MPDVDRERWDRVRRALAEAKLDALVCRLAENVVLLTGYYPNIGGSMVVFPREGEPTLILPRFENDLADRGWVADRRQYDTWQNRYPPPLENLSRLLRQVVDEKGLTGAAVGYEGDFETIAPNGMGGEPTGVGAPTARLIGEAVGGGLHDATQLLYQLRARKTPTELARLRIANEVATIGLRAFKEHAVEGAREVDVSAAVEGAIRREGAGHRGSRFAFAWAQVTAGPATSVNWQYPLASDRRLRRGDLVVIELGTVVDGYWSDLTRTVTVGPASDRQRELYELVRRAQQASLQAVRPGASGREVDAAGRRIIESGGYGEAFVHHTGHGIGFRYHEPIPFVAPHSTHTLEEGHVHSIEPGVYLEGFGGCRLEEICAVGPSGGEILSATDFGLD
ncbi:MAG TPA: Xaa-Pro peptidase family protein [Chloroflexota bacterium]|nr:Xaa-Pro peptidase family protein [Chloroflexota bacterium]